MTNPSISHGHGYLTDCNNLYALTVYTCSGNGNAGGTTTVCATLTQGNDFWNGCYIKYLTGSNAGNVVLVSDFDAGNALTVQNLYAKVPYPLIKELYDGSTIDVLIILGKAKSTPLLGHDHAAFGYKEQVPITLATIDKTSVTGDKTITQCETELRRIMETNPLGSTRTLEQTRETTEVLGSTTLYQIEYVMNYSRCNT